MTETEVCPINIGPKQRRMRAIAGVVGLLLAAGVAIGLASAGVGVVWRAAAVFVLAYGGSLGLLQARAKT